MKKIWSIVLTLIMILGSAVTVFADETAQHLITVTNEAAGHVYEAYQIFKGDLDEENKVLSNVEWGSGIDGTSFLAQLMTDAMYEGCRNASDVAEVLAGFSNDSEELDHFAKLAESHLTGVAAGKSTEESSPYTIPVTGDGYYLIKDTATPGDGDAYTKFILQVVKDVEVEAKGDAPKLEKKIVEEEGLVDANSVAVGDLVSYQLTTNVPQMDGYEKYFFVVHDILDDGLEFQADTVKITLGEQVLDASSYQIIEEDLEDGCSFEIVFLNFIQYKAQAGSSIIISYSAMAGQEAVIGNVGNTNRAYLEYSNNPNVEQNGLEENPDKPGVGEETGKTPEDITVSYITGIQLTKIDDSEAAIPLQGAEFKISGECLNQIKVVKGVYEQSDTGTYYKLKDGTYTVTEPQDTTMDRYDSVEIKYAYSNKTEWITVAETVDTKAMVGSDGKLCFYGLSAGTYEIEEITAPNGYNLLKEPIVVEVKLNAPDTVATGLEEAVWNYSVSGAMVQEERAAQSGIIVLDVVNKAGIILPSTGGAGTYAFYIIGVGLAVGAIIGKRKKNKMNEM